MLSPITNLDYTVLPCSRMRETRAFYLEVMGFPLEVDREHWVNFRVGAVVLALRPRDQPEPLDGEIPHAGPAAVQLAFRVPPPAVDAWHEALVARGVPILRGPVDLPTWRHRAVFFCDPEDNILEIYAEY